MADADADADPTLEADLRTTAALRAVLEAREADETTRLVQELKRRPILEDVIFVGKEYRRWGSHWEPSDGVATIPRSKAPWFFGLLDHYDWAIAEHYAPPPTYPATPFHSFKYFAPWTSYGSQRYDGTFAQPDGSGAPDDDDDARFWPFEVLFGQYEKKEALAFCEEVLGMSKRHGYTGGAYQVDAYWRLKGKVETLLCSDSYEYKLSEEEAAKKDNYKVVAMVTVHYL